MCGIYGFAGFTDNSLLEKMRKILHYRGPDEYDLFTDKKNKVFLGHNRLAIIDLKTGKQPISNEDGNVTVVFNGEIYNFQDLKEQLTKKGHFFRTNSDTEVLVHLYEDYQYEMPKFLNGIFAFAIFDKKKKEIFLARDDFGVKPLFYYFQNKRLVFASEIKAILQTSFIKAETNLKALHYAMNLRFVPGDNTLFKNIFKLNSGHFLAYNLDTNKILMRQYSQKEFAVQKNMKEREAIEGIQHYVKQAVKRQLISDVPLGAYLSGGIDSSAVVAFAAMFKQDLKTFSMGFNEPTDEVNDAKRVANYFDIENFSMYTDLEPLKLLKEVLWHVEEPKVNMIQGYLISQFAKQHVKVVLSGLGGDELFAGYTNNNFLNFLGHLHKIIPKNSVFNLISNLLFKLDNKIGKLNLNEYRRGLQLLFSYGNKEKFYGILRNIWDFDLEFYDEIYSRDISSMMKKFQTLDLFTTYFQNKTKHIVEQALDAEFHIKMVDDFLVNEDRTSMANSIESRVPLLDKDLVQFAFSIPYHLKIRNNQTKYIFKQAMKGILPDFVLKKKKWGFAINPYYQYQKDLKKVAFEVLTKKKIQEQGIFNYAYIQKILNHPVSPRLRWHYYQIWWMVGFQHWYELFIQK